MSSLASAASLRREDRLAAWSVGMLLLAVYLATFAGLPESPEAEVDIQTASALVRTGRADLGGTPEAEALIVQGRVVAQGAGEREGQWYSRQGIAQALVAVPFLVAGRWMAAVWPHYELRHGLDRRTGERRSEYIAHLAVAARNALLGAWTAFLWVLAARRLGVGRSVAWWCGLALGLSTFAWARARSGLDDVQATFFLMLAFYGIVRVRSGFARLRAPRVSERLVIGMVLALAVATRPALLPAAMVLLGAAAASFRAGQRELLRAWERQAPSGPRRALATGLWVALPFAAGLGLIAAWNRARFGSILETGHGLSWSERWVPAAEALAWIGEQWVAPGCGLLWMAPGLLLVPLALDRAQAHGDAFWRRTTVALAMAVIVPAAFLRTQPAPWTYGPSDLLPFLPFAWLGVGLALESRRGRRPLWRRLAAALFGLGLVVQIAGAGVDARTHRELALQAAREVWPTPQGADEQRYDDRRLERLQWDWRFAAPWAHLRILRHRTAGQGERFAAREIFFVDTRGELEPTQARERGFAHLAWVDFHRRLGGPLWPAVLACGVLVLLGVVAALESAQRSGVRR